MSTLLYDDVVTLPSNADVLTEASRMSNIERFLHLWQHTKLLVEKYGPYTTLAGTTVFIRASGVDEVVKDPPIVRLALSLAAAQDCVNSAQPDGPVKDDLLLFKRLWETSITILEEILARGSLPQETFGWGIFGLASGYEHPPPSSSPSHNHLVAKNIFSSHKYRLQAALLRLPSMNGRRRSEYEVSEKTRVDALVSARRQIHFYGHILLEEFRKGSWGRVRWLHAVEVCEKWIRAFGLLPRTVREEVPVEMFEEVHEEVPEEVPEKVSGEAQEEAHEEASEEMEEKGLDEIQEQASEPAPEETRDEADVEVPDGVQEVQEKVPEERPEKEPGRKEFEIRTKRKLPNFAFPHVKSL
jgi:hypothetical protein